MAKPNSSLDPSAWLCVIESVLATLPAERGMTPEEAQTRRDAAIAAMEALDPQDTIEAMLAAHAVIAHFAAMSCLRRSASPEVSDQMVLRLRKEAVALARRADEGMRELERRHAANRSAQRRATLRSDAPSTVKPEGGLAPEMDVWTQALAVAGVGEQCGDRGSGRDLVPGLAPRPAQVAPWPQEAVRIAAEGPSTRSGAAEARPGSAAWLRAPIVVPERAEGTSDDEVVPGAGYCGKRPPSSSIH